MTKKPKSNEEGTIGSMVTMAIKLTALVSNLVEIFRSDTNRAHHGFFKAVILALITGILFATTWLCILGIIIYSLYLLNVALPIAIIMVILINLLLTIIVLLLLLRAKDQMTFRETRKTLHDITHHLD